MKSIFFITTLICSFNAVSLEASKKLTCNERMRHGPRGVAKAAAAATGCAALWYLSKGMWSVAEPLRAPADMYPPEIRRGAAESVGYTAVAMAALGYVTYMLGRSSHESLTIFFTEDPDQDELQNNALAHILKGGKDMSPEKIP